MVTTIILPAIKKFKSPEEAVEFFEKVERRFQIQARVTTMVTGLSGFYMISKLHGYCLVNIHSNAVYSRTVYSKKQND